MVSQPVVSLRYPVGRSPEAWMLPEGPVPESTAHDAALERIGSLLKAWAARTHNGARIARNLAIRWLPKHPRTGIDPDVAVLLPGPTDFDELTSYRVWEVDRPPPALAIEVVSSGHPYKDYSWVHEGYAAMGAFELLVFDPQLFGPESLGGPVLLQLWRRDAAGVFERVHFGDDPVHSQLLDAWLMAEGRSLVIAEDRDGMRRWPTLEEAAALEASARFSAEAERSKAEAERSKAEAERSKAEAERSKAEAERERSLRAELEAKLAELTAQRRE